MGKRSAIALTPAQYNLARLALLHYLETFFELGVMETVGDHRRNIQATFEHDRHFVPRFIHFAAVDTFNGKHIEDHRVPIDSDGFRWNSEDSYFATVAHRIDHRSKCGR